MRNSKKSDLFVYLQFNALKLAIVLVIMPASVPVDALQRQGPRFVVEPPNRIDFLNSTGVSISCTAEGNPTPTIMWMRQDGVTLVEDVPRLRQVRADGSLVFQPFKAKDYRQDVHSGVYRCVAENVVGSIISREVKVRAAVHQFYETQVYNDFVINGNTAVLRCHLPSFVKEYVNVVAWIRDDGLVIKGDSGGRYSVFPSGALHIRQAGSKTDSSHQYYCQTKHRISGEVKRSATAGKLIVTEPHINSPPRITDRQAHIFGNQGKKTELPCSAYGFPPPTYRWFRLEAGNRVPVQLGGRIQQVEGTLIFQKTQVRDAGKYVCVVNNSVGEERGETELMVTAPLSVSITPRRVVAEEGQAVDFNCSVTGHPVRSVLWLRNHRPLVVGGRSQLVNKERLRISHVLREDKGMYQCLAVNDWETTQGTAELKLGDDPPVFSFTFAEQTLEPGPSVSLKCAATGNPLPQITWTLDGTNIADNLRVRVGDFVTSDGYVNSFVNVSSLRTEDGGRYQCQATNEVATVFHEARVNVFGRPYVRPMENRTVLGGSTLILHCPAAGYPIQEIFWEKGGSRLPHSRRQTAFPNGTIVIEKVDRSMDEGKYHCTAINSKGEKASGTTYVMVQVAPSITSFSFPTNLRKGLRITVTCSVLEGDSPITIAWLKDGQRILRSETDIVIESSNEFSSTLFVKNVDFRHNGNYTCLASNLAAKTNYTAPMIVNVPPEWKITPTDTAVVTGQTVVIDCQAEGFPQPRIWWENSDGSSPPVYRTIISNSHIHTLENGSLMIREAEEGDSGFYLCQASNGVGTGLSKVIRVNVHVAAHFRSPFHTVTLKIGDTAKLPCRAFGERPINFVWRKERAPVDTSKPRIQIVSTEVEDGMLSEILIESVERHDSSTYTCVGSNAFGEDERNIQLIVQEAPDVATNIHATEVTSRSITINWTPPFNGNSPITAYKIEYRGDNDSWSSKAKATSSTGSVILPGSESSFSIRGLKPVTNYQIRISSENALGWSRPSQTVHVSTGEEAPEGPPISVKASAITSRSVRITWQSPKKEHRNGKLKGYYLGYRIQNSPNPYNYRTIEIGEGFKEEAVISTLRRASKYSIVVQAFNSKGSGPPSDEIVIETLENDPPVAVVLSVEAVTTSSIHLQWNAPLGDNPPVSGYYLYSHKEQEAWDDRQMAAHQTSYTYQNLDCGCLYEFYIVAFNGIGKSKASSTVGSRTQGGVSIAPDKDSFIEINSTSVLLQLSAWQTNGCPIKYFVIQYKGHSQKEWILVSNNIMPNQKSVLVTDLSPATWYTALVVAHTDAGPTEAEYIFATLTMGGVAPPFTAMDERRSALYRSLGIVVPASCAIVVLFVISVVACVVVMKRRRHDNTPVRECRLREEKSCEGMNMSVLDRKPGSPESGSIPKDQLYYPSPYATSRVLPGSHKHIMEGGESSQSMRRTIGRREHIYEVPYPPPKWEEDEDSYSHIMESSSVPLHPSHNLYQTPRIMPPLPVRPPVEKNPVRLVHATRSPYRHSSLTSEGHSGEESDSEGTTYTFHGGQHAFRSFGDSHELSEAECDRDQRDAFGKGKKVYVPVLDEADFRRLHVT